MYQDFSTKGDDSPANPIQWLTQKTVGAAMGRKSFSPSDAVEFLRPYHGDGTPDVLTSLKKVSEAHAAIIKLCPAWFWQGDGLTPGGLQTLRCWMLMGKPGRAARHGLRAAGRAQCERLRRGRSRQ
jgi:hypothetical protein